ncbi:MAG: cytochrome c oxidase subunit II [Pseudomonadota bacterium]
MSTPWPLVRVVAVAVAMSGAASCSGIQSALDPASPDAREIAALWWVMFGASMVIFALVLALLAYAIVGTPGFGGRMAGNHFIVIGGVVFPVVVLSLMVPFNTTVSSGASAAREPDTLTIHVRGRMWWWDVRYDDGTPGGGFRTANEIRLPVGEPVELLLTSRDVIHSLWIPRLAGKMDLIPGQTNRLMIEADEPGRFRGQCAEFCGASHAKMALYAVALPRERFDAWYRRQRDTAAAPVSDAGRRGAGLFAASGCGVCHTVRGHGADGRGGPDLTHVGSRLTLGAGLLPADRAHFSRWLAHNQTLKPENRMPEFTELSPEARNAIGAYLEELE